MEEKSLQGNGIEECSKMTDEKSLYEQLRAYSESGYYPYHMPGHKRRQLGELPAGLLETDITEIDGFDNLHQPEGILRSLQERANKLYGADETFYLVNGSTCGVLSAISAALPEGGRLLMARESHMSAYHAVYLRKLHVSYLYPGRVKGFDMAEAVTPAAVEQALSKQPDVGAVFLVSPTYEGRIAKIGEIAEIVHRRGIPLIVDEAHGAHLGFAEKFAEGSCPQGADLVIHSVHKTLPAMTQTALLHVNGERIDRAKLRRFLHIYQSSSPSYVLMTSIGDAMRVVEGQGRDLFSRFFEQYRELAERLQTCRNLRFIPWQDIEDRKQDIGKLVISAGGSGVSGKWIYDVLREEYHLQCEMAAGSYCLAMFTIADGPEAYRKMGDALLAIDERLGTSPGTQTVGQGTRTASPETQTADTERGMPRGNRGEEGDAPINSPQTAFALSQAWDMPCKMTDMSDTIGCPVGDFINLYPPGVPLLVPGEVLSRGLYDKIVGYLDSGYHVQGVERRDGTDWIKVLEV